MKKGNSKMKKVLFIVDAPNWAHDFKTDQIMEKLDHKYLFRKIYQKEVVEEDLELADIIVVYYWMQFGELHKFDKYLLNKKVLCGICSNWETNNIRVMDEIINKYACGVFVNNNFLFKEFKDYYKVPVFYTPNGVDTDLFADKKRSNKIKQTYKIGWAGSATNQGRAHRGLDLIIEAVNKLKQRYPIELITATREIKWRSQKEMVDFYNDLDVYVCASESEGTPNTALEAASCHVPVVTTYVGNMPEFIIEGVNGFFTRRYAVDIENKIVKALKYSWNNGPKRDMREDILYFWDWRWKAQHYDLMFDAISKED